MHAFAIETIELTTPSLRLAGNCGYAMSGDRVIIDIDAICNDRPAGDISGTLSIELWALESPYSGGEFVGVPLAGTRIGEVLGQNLIPNCRYDLIFQAPPPGDWNLVLMVREWTAAGYVTRDHVQFPLPYRVAPISPLVGKEAANVISVEFDPAKRQEVLDESRKVKVEPAEPARPEPEVKAVKAEKSEDNRVSINRASHKEIASVKGISRKLADNIVAARPFGSLDDLLRVKGIGARLLAKIRHLISI
jgi:predicted flap endonuclease-1-like 5' DNA nuclease